MPDTDAPSRSDSSASERVNLPAVVPQPAPAPQRESHDTWLARVLRAVFGWKTSPRADLQTVLANGALGESGFSPQERVMLTNILALRGRRIDDVMVPRADIIAVQRDISLGDLIKVFEGAGHSRLVAYNETLDDPVGMVHIRDVIGYMVRHAAAGATKAKRRKPFPAGLDLKAVDLAMPLSETKIVREILFVPPSMPAIDLLAKMQTTRIHLSLVVDEYGGADGVVSIEDIVEQIVGDIEDEHDDDEAPAVVRQHDGSFLADARAARGRGRGGRTRIRGQRGDQRSRYAGRLHHDAGRAAAGARRGGAGSGRIRDRGARRRPAPHQARENPRQGESESADTAEAGGGGVTVQA